MALALAPLPPVSEPAAERRLADLAPGQQARVLAIEAPDTRVGRRLLDLGFVPGTAVRMVRRAPLGDPIEFELRGFRICLRRGEAGRIRVAPG